MSRKKTKFDMGKELRAIARERIGTVQPSKTFLSKKDKARSARRKALTPEEVLLRRIFGEE